MQTVDIASIAGFLNALAPPYYQESYDNAGLLIKSGSTAKGALVALDCTEEVLDEAREEGMDMVIVHHPIIFKGLKKLAGSNYVERVVQKAVKEGISVFAIHTNLDNVFHGVNHKIADLIGLQECRILSPKPALLCKLICFVPEADAEKLRNALFEKGAGNIGDYSECSYNLEGKGTFKALDGAEPYVGNPGERHTEAETRIEVIYPAYLENSLVEALKAAHPYEEPAFDLIPLLNVNDRVGSGMIGQLPEPENVDAFLKRVKSIFDCGTIKYTRPHKETIRKVAVCGGSGFFLLPNAIRKQADIFITSDVKYHEFFDADSQIILADIGHYESEQFTSDLLVENIVKKFPTFAVRKSKVKTNPVKYL